MERMLLDHAPLSSGTERAHTERGSAHVRGRERNRTEMSSERVVLCLIAEGGALLGILSQQRSRQVVVLRVCALRQRAQPVVLGLPAGAKHHTQRSARSEEQQTDTSLCDKSTRGPTETKVKARGAHSNASSDCMLRCAAHPSRRSPPSASNTTTTNQANGRL